MGEPGGVIPSTDPFQEVVELVAAERLGFGRRRLSEPQSSGAEVGQQLQRDGTDPAIEVSGLFIAQAPPVQDEVGAFAYPIDGVNLGVESLQIVDSFDERPLPAALQIEVVDRSIAEIEGECPLFEAGEDGIAVRRDRFQADSLAI